MISFLWFAEITKYLSEFWFPKIGSCYLSCFLFLMGLPFKMLSADNLVAFHNLGALNEYV